MPNTGSANTDLVALLGGTGGFNDDVTTIQGIANRTLTTSATTSGTPANTSENTLWSYSLPANTLNANGRGIRVVVWGVCGATADQKTIRLKFGSATVITRGPVALNGDTWMMQMVILRSGSNTQQSLGWNGDGVAAAVAPVVAAQTQTDTAAITIALTGQSAGGTLNDVVLRGAVVETLY